MNTNQSNENRSHLLEQKTGIVEEITRPLEVQEAPPFGSTAGLWNDTLTKAAGPEPGTAVLRPEGPQQRGYSQAPLNRRLLTLGSTELSAAYLIRNKQK
jgi:hypothetical protein